MELVTTSPSTPPRAIVVVAHGLNLKPIKMSPIAQTLNESGYNTVQVGLSGHLGSEREFKSVTRELWLGEMYAAYREARRLADQQNLPLHFVGYSLGALMNLDLMNTYRKNEIHYDRMVLFAPPAALRIRGYFFHFFGALGILGPDFVIPSLAHPEYRANPRGTPVAAYQALFDSLHQIKKYGLQKSNAPTLVLIDPKDELVNPTRLESLIRKNHLTHWQVMKVTKLAPEMKKKNYHHLIIDEMSLGVSKWRDVQGAMISHLTGST